MILTGYHARMRDARAEAVTADRPRGRVWLVLFHQIPPKPDYLRVRIGRRLRELGAVALKNTVYVLPSSAPFRERLGSIVREIRERGGEAVAGETRFVAGMTDTGLEDRFRETRDAEYAEVNGEAKRLVAALRAGRPAKDVRAGPRTLARLTRRFRHIVTLDRFGAGGRDATAELLSLAEDLLAGVETAARATPSTPEPPRAATWVTRSGVMVDRMASAWLIRRFIDPGARFKFVTGRGYRPGRSEIRFDMAGAEFTHADGRCTFEVLLDRFRLRDSALRPIGEMVHDLDLADQRYGRPETSGLGRMVTGIALSTPDDGARLQQGAMVFDGLYESFRKPG
jgi:hypothetical protein